MLEDNVDEKYYLSDKMLEGFMTHNEKHQAKGTGFLFKPTDGGAVAPTLTCGCETTHARIEDNAIKDIEMEKKQKYRIRKLTEREAFRLMGVKDEDSDKIREVVSKSQCYKLAGNSIVVDVMVHMFDQLFFNNKNTNQQLELF